jgi:hypothetical protein
MIFGGPKFSDGPFLLREISNGFAATVSAMEAEHPNATAADVQALMVWVFALVLHCVLSWGRTDENAVALAFAEFGAMMQRETLDGKWSLDEFSSEIERCQRLLRTHVSKLDYEGSKEASIGFYRGIARKQPEPTLAEEDFVRFGVTTIAAAITRLRGSGHIK